MNHYKNNLLEELHRLTEAVQASHADIAPTYLEYTQLAFANHGLRRGGPCGFHEPVQPLAQA